MEDKAKRLIAYDIASTPEGVSIETIMEIWGEEQVLFYDSTKGCAPIFIEQNEFQDTDQFVDIATAKGRKMRKVIVKYMQQ